MQLLTRTMLACLLCCLVAVPALAEDAGISDEANVSTDAGVPDEAGVSADAGRSQQVGEEGTVEEGEEEEEAQEEPGTRVSGEELYEQLSTLARQGGHGGLIFRALEGRSRELDWSSAREISFIGNVRHLEVARSPGEDPLDFYLVREESGEIYVLDVPEDLSSLPQDSPYANLEDAIGSKVTIAATMTTTVVDGVEYRFIRFTEQPARMLLDRLFHVAIILLLFLVMIGMGLTLTPRDFALVFKKPMGMIIGPVFQFGLMPLIALIIGKLAGYYETYPFIFLGLILVAASPGGVTSNIMTYFGKGDLALSVSLTAVCTVLALFFTPFLLTVFGGNVPAFSIPVTTVVSYIAVLVIVPLFVGMVIRWRAESFARRSEKIFALLGIFSLLFLIVVGILGNLEKFADTNRYGVKFYAVTFLLTLIGMLAAGGLAKLLRISNFQVRAISIECGLRNASLAMTIAILIQDRMGDFYSSMLFTSGIFGLWMYLAGTITIFTFPKWLPVTKEDLKELERAKRSKKSTSKAETALSDKKKASEKKLMETKKVDESDDSEE